MTTAPLKRSEAEIAARAVAARNLPPNAPRILRRPEVEAMTGLRKTSLYEMMRTGIFPQSVALGQRARGWLAPEVYAWIESRAALRCVSQGG